MPGEPRAFGAPDAILGLLRAFDRWSCVEADSALAADLEGAFRSEFGLERRVIDVVHVLPGAGPQFEHSLVRQLTAAEQERAVSSALFPEASVLGPAIGAGRVFAAFDHDRVVGHGSSFAASDEFADVSVHVAESHRGRGIATAAAARAIRAVQDSGLVPVWGAGSHNTASLRVAEKLGFVAVERLVYLVKG